MLGSWSCLLSIYRAASSSASESAAANHGRKTEAKEPDGADPLNAQSLEYLGRASLNASRVEIAFLKNRGPYSAHTATRPTREPAPQKSRR